MPQFSRSLVGKTALVIAVTTLVMAVATYLPLRYVLLASFDALERQRADDNLVRAQSAIQDELDGLQATTRDYAVWDETHAFLRNGNSEFVTVNFAPTTFEANRLNFVVLLDAQGQIKLALGHDYGQRRPHDPPRQANLLAALPSAARGKPEPHSGLVNTTDGLTLVASHPVLHSDGKGEAAGTLVLGRWLDSREMKRLAARTRLTLSAEPLVTPKVGSAATMPTSSAGTRSVVRLIDEQRSEGEVQLNDLRDAPAAVLRVAMTREIHAEGLQATRYLLLTVGLAGLLMGLVVVAVLHRVVVRRVIRLAHEVAEIGQQASHARRVDANGSDEIGHLGRRINAMLGSLEELNQRLHTERAKSERLLRNMLPESVCDRLKDNPAVIADKFDQTSVLFADIVGFTDLSTRVPAEEVVRLLNELFSRFDALADDFGVEKIKTIGDAYMVAAGVPEPRGDHAHVSAEMALAMLDCVRRFNDEQGQTFAVRIGMHSGPLVGGVIGVRKFLYDIWGDTVNIASRMESTGIVGQIQVTDETRRRLRHQYHFTDRGLQTVKGRGEMHTWLLTGRMGEATMQRQAHLKRTGSASLAALLSDQ